MGAYTGWFCPDQALGVSWALKKGAGGEADLSLPGDGLVEEQVAGLGLIDAVVGRGVAEGLGAVGGQWRRRCGRVGLVAGGAPAPVAAAAAAGWGTALLPGSAHALCEPDNQRQCGRVQGPGSATAAPPPPQKCATAGDALRIPWEERCITPYKH